MSLPHQHWVQQTCIASAIVIVLGVAQPPPCTANPRAKALHQQALSALRSSHFARAHKLWLQAYALDRNPKYLYNIARMSIELDQPAEALKLFEQFVSQVRNQRRYLRQLANARVFIFKLKRQVAVLTVSAPQVDVQVMINEVRLPPGPVERTVRLRPGRHVVTATLAGHHGETRTLDLGAGTKRSLTIELNKIEHKVIAKPATLKYPLPVWLPWTALGVGLAIAGGGGGALGVAAQKFDAFDRSVDQNNPDPALETQGKKYRAIGIGLLATGGALAIGGLIAILLNRPRLVPRVDEGSSVSALGPRLSLTLWVAPGSVSFSIAY